METNSYIDQYHWEQYPSLIGVIPPGLRNPRICPTQKNGPENYTLFFRDIKEFINNFGYKGQYHNLEHFHDVQQRFHQIINYMRENHPGDINEQDLILAEMFSFGHDCVHNAGRTQDEKFFFSIESICELYGIHSPNKAALTHVLLTINEGIAEDNDLSGAKRDLVGSFTEPITQLSEEEMSSIVIDALAAKNNIGVHIRSLSFGMVQATEVKRALSEKGSLPGFKWPRTQLEVLAKLADIGNFADDIDKWLEISTDVFEEAPWFEGSTPTDFIDAQLNFIDNYIFPSLDKKNLPIEVFEDRVSTVRIPNYFAEKAQEKRDYLLALKAEIEASTPGIDMPSPELENFISRTSRALTKNSPVVADSSTPAPIALLPIQRKL